jgi:DNA-binding response OmpR family regulator
MLATHFRRNGFQVEYAMSAEEVASDEEYAVVLTDVHLPGESGVDLLRRIHDARPMQPIVVLTGDPDEATARAAFDSGAAGYLRKPFEFFELHALVHGVIHRMREAANADNTGSN